MEAGDNLAQHQQDKEGKETDVCSTSKTYIHYFSSFLSSLSITEAPRSLLSHLSSEYDSFLRE
jgi:hypothetical protein